jgi:phosphonopyruvate decarboxylase
VIEAAQFVEAARERGFDWYAGVPCSYLTPFINYVLQDETLNYVSAANEGDAVALIAGVALGARNGRRGISMMQNSGLGNAVSPLTSLTWTFRLPQLLIVTWRGQPGVPDEPQHALMGPITTAMLDTMEIPWELFPVAADAIGPALDRATEYMDRTGRPYALVMQKGSVAPYALKKTGLSGVRQAVVRADVQRVAGERVTRKEALQRVIARTPKESTVVLASTGFCGRELYALDDRDNQLYLVGSMGCVTPMALGLALSRPDLQVVALDGDGAALMRMGVFATLGAYGPSNLVHLLLDNGAHESTGGQATVSHGVEFARIASACGYALALDGHDPSVIDRLFDADNVEGVRFARLSIERGTAGDLPRPSVTPEGVRARLQTHIRR